MTLYLIPAWTTVGLIVSRRSDRRIRARVGSQRASIAASPGRGLIGLRYSIPHAGHVRVSIYDVTGHRVARPVDGPEAAGWHQASFPGGNAPQLLFYRVEWDGRSLSGSIPFLR